MKVLFALLGVLALSACGQSDFSTSVRQTGSPQTSSRSVEQPGRPARQSPIHDLSTDEAMGGHTLKRHVGKRDAELIERLRREPHISSASTYTDRATAERVVGAALESDDPAFAAWRGRSGPRPNFVLRYHADHAIGRSITRGRAASVSCDRAIVVLRWDDGRQRYYVLTSYPEATR